MKIAIIGAGAAGCFCAVELKRRVPSADVIVVEGGRKALAKVAITGGGRCNLTNSFEGISSLSEVYPRGHRLMKRLFNSFDQTDTWKWFEGEGVRLVLQDDHCVFPASQDAMEIVNLLLRRMRQEGVELCTGCKVTAVRKKDGGGYSLNIEGKDSLDADIVVVTTGGSPRPEGLCMLQGLGLEFVKPVPSLFTFNIPGDGVRELMGTVVEYATASLAGTRFSASGPLLITHWGMSGPAILKLSSHAARHLAENGYKATLLVKWLEGSEEQVRGRICSLAREGSHRMVANTHPEEIPSRLWTHLAAKAGLRDDARWSEIGSKGTNRLVNILMNDEYSIAGKSRFKDEFVTCGGVALSNLDQNTLESKANPGLYFAGEVTDVDAVTGGFNLQAAWTMGHAVASAIERKTAESR
jgi:flavoprotein, HI0933 family